MKHQPQQDTLDFNFDCEKKLKYVIIKEDIQKSQRVEAFDIYIKKKNGKYKKAASETIIGSLRIDEYIDILKACVDIIPKNVVIHRLTGDGAKKDLFPFKHMGRGICVGECLKISNILSAFYFLRGIFQNCR